MLVYTELVTILRVNPLRIIPDCVRDLCLRGPALYLESNYRKAAVEGIIFAEESFQRRTRLEATF